MARYDRPSRRRYDFGMRGYRETTRPLGRRRFYPPGYDTFYLDSYSEIGQEIPLPNRITRRYNREYVDDRLNRRRRYSYGFGGDRLDRMVDEDYYRPPYSTIGGTRTRRGVRPPPPFDPGRYGPDYGGRFPDEL